MTAFRVLVVALLLLGVCTVTLAADEPTPQQEKELAVKLISLLEHDPFHKTAQDARHWLTLWLIRVPDITVKGCGAFHGPYFDKDKKYSSELFNQTLYGQAAFLISNPSSTGDDFLLYRAGLISSIRAYQSIVRAKPKARDEYFDSLVAKLDAGGLDDFVRSKMSECK
jgi:hypothetical protein